MILKIEYSEEDYLKIDKITQEELKEEYEDPYIFTQDVLNISFFNIIFRIPDKIISYKDKKTGYIYTNNDGTNIWNINKYDPDTQKIEVIDTIRREKIDVFINEYKEEGFTKKLNELKSKDIMNNLKLFLKENYKAVLTNEIYTILFFGNKYAREIYQTDVFFIELSEAKSKKLLKYNNKENLKTDFQLKNNNTSKKMVNFVKSDYLKSVLQTDLTSLKKTHSFFNGKIHLDGLYVYRFSYDFFNSVNEYFENRSQKT